MLWRLDQTRAYLRAGCHNVLASDSALPVALAGIAEEAEVFAFERDTDKQASEETYLFGDGENTLANCVGHTLFSRTSMILYHANMPQADLDRYRPWYAAMQVEQAAMLKSKLLAGFGTEGMLKARTAGKVWDSLENESAAFAAFTRHPKLNIATS